MVLFAFSLQAEVEKYGAYVGIAAFFGLAVLSLLYFAQAREVKRLREWAGRAPERAAELEVAVAEHAQEVRRAPVTPVPRPQPQPVVQPLSPSVAVAATNGAVKLKPEEVAALAFARAAGVHEPHLPKAHPVAAAVAAPPTEVAAAGAQALNGGGNGTSRSVPAPATPAARRSDVPPPPPLPPRRAAGTPGRRPVAPPPRREGSSMVAVVVTAIIGVLVIGGLIFLFTRGGDDAKTPPVPTVEATPTADGGKGGKATATPTSPPAPTKTTALIAIYNGTPQGGLAADEKKELTDEAYPSKNIAVDTAPAGQQRPTSVVFYRRGAKAAATGVADTLGMTAVQLLDDATQALIANSPKKWDVVVIVGSDKTS
jgi:hypothetical protein